MKLKLLTLTLTFLLSGCVTAPDPIYSPEQIISNKMSLIKAVTNEFTADGVESSILRIIRSDGEVILEPVLYKSFATETHLTAGEYTIQLMCKNVFGQASPILPISIEKSKKYHVTCETHEKATSKHDFEYTVSANVNIQEVGDL